MSGTMSAGIGNPWNITLALFLISVRAKVRDHT
jgi:hypothetical protein